MRQLSAPQVNLTDNWGTTALMRACEVGHLGIIRELLKHPDLSPESVLAALQARMVAWVDVYVLGPRLLPSTDPSPDSHYSPSQWDMSI